MPPNAENNAIPAGDVDVDATDRPKSAREIAMEQIDQANMRRLEEESGVKIIDEDEDPDEQLEQQLTLPEPAPAAVAAPAPTSVKTKVDGEEREVPLDELVRSYQKNATADKRLEEATRLLREANERSAQLAAQVTAPKTPDPVPASDVQAQVKDALGKLYEGDTEAAAAVFGALLANPRGGDQPTPAPQIDIDQIAAQVEERTAASIAISRVQTDYPDIYANSDLEALTAMKAQALIAAGSTRAQAILTSAEDVYRLIGKTPVGRPTVPTTAPVNEKLVRKQQMDQIPVASSTAASPTDEDDTGPSATIRAMAAKRLGQSLPAG